MEEQAAYKSGKDGVKAVCVDEGVNGEVYKDCEGNIVTVGDFIQFNAGNGGRRYSEVVKLERNHEEQRTYAYIYDRYFSFTILELSLLCKNH